MAERWPALARARLQPHGPGMSTPPSHLSPGPDSGHVISDRLADVLRRLEALEELAVRSGFSTHRTVRLELWTARRAVERAAADADALIATARAQTAT